MVTSHKKKINLESLFETVKSKIAGSSSQNKLNYKHNHRNILNSKTKTQPGLYSLKKISCNDSSLQFWFIKVTVF